MDVSPLQRNLAAHGYDPGAIDGALGPKTYAALTSYAADRHLGVLGDLLGAAMAKHLGDHQIITRMRICHWLAQGAHETANFRYFVELGGPSYFAHYDNRPDLGNTQPGDGYRYRGRGIFQITGRFNYRTYGALVGLPLETNPDLAAEPETSVHIACDYWAAKGLNALADANDIVTITRRINGGYNGLDSRRAHRDALLAIWPG